MSKPFRWNVARREQLGALVHGDPAESYHQFRDDLRRCSARVLAAAGDSRLVFVGRSPESLFDYLSGALADSSWADRPVLLNVSLRWSPEEPSAAARSAIREQFDHLALDPARIATAARRVALIDLVDSGTTLGALVELLTVWADEARVDVSAVRRRLRVVGITQRTENSPKTWRWQQQSTWAAAFRSSALQGVSVPARLWDYLGNQQKKVARSNPHWRWADSEMRRPPRAPERAAALRLAVALYESGRTREEREALARELAAQRTAMRHRWLRKLVTELRSKA